MVTLQEVGKTEGIFGDIMFRSTNCGVTWVDGTNSATLYLNKPIKFTGIPVRPRSRLGLIVSLMCMGRMPMQAVAQQP